MSAFVLKIIAIIAMTCDHMSYLIFGHASFLNYIGRIAFPIFAYQITEGYIHTHSLKKYFLRLCAFALISQIPFYLFTSIFTDSFSLNIFFTLLLGLLGVTIYDKIDKLGAKNNYFHRLFNFISFVLTGCIAYFASFIHADYGAFGVMIIFFFYVFRNHKLLMNISFIISVLVYYGEKLIIPPFASIYLGFAVCTIIPLLFINLYNHKKGKDIKYFLYLFYPVHLLIIYLLSLIVNS